MLFFSRTSSPSYSCKAVPSQCSISSMPSLPLCRYNCDFSKQRNHNSGPYSNRLYSDERPMPRFCVANNCGRMIFPEPFQHESNLCDVCIRIRSCDPFPVANNSINGDTSQSFVFTSSGGFPHELHGNTFRQPGGSNYVPVCNSIHSKLSESYYVLALAFPECEIFESPVFS